MALDDQDIAAIGRLLDERMDQRAAAARRRALFWVLLAMLAATLASCIAYAAIRRRVEAFQARMAQQEQDWRESKAAYQKLLLENEAMRREREAAAKAVAYRPQQDKAGYEAELLRSTFALIGKAGELGKGLEDPAAADDLDALEAQAKAQAALAGEALGIIGRMLLRNTDPAHNTPAENRALQLEQGEEAAQAAPGTRPAEP